MHAPAPPPANRGLSWLAIIRIGLVQASIGAMVMLITTVLNRLMVVEYALAGAIPAALVGWHYAVQLGRPLWGHGSDKGGSRSLWIAGGIVVLGLGAIMAVQATVMIQQEFTLAMVIAVLGYTLIGVGVGASGTSALALLASGVAPERRAAAAAVTWIMMVAGIVVSAITVGALLQPFSPERLLSVASGLLITCIAITCIAVYRIEPRSGAVLAFAETAKSDPPPDFKEALREILHEKAARRFTLFIFVSMMAFNMQDLILEPFAGLIFGMTPGQSTQLGGMQSGGVLVGMIVAGIGGSAFAGRLPFELRHWIVFGCLGSALALACLAIAAQVGPGWPIAVNVFVLGFCNGLFAVAAIGAMMGLAGAGEKTREGVRMGVWGAAQAIAFGLGGMLGGGGLDVARRAIAHDPSAFQIVFAIEAGLFVLAAWLAVRATARGLAPARAIIERDEEVFA
ncbi:possible Bch2, light harvesting pigment Major Facilitator Family(MFS) transporter [Erythrobacter sp. NAP1]|uniref:BCD family MFS transporter n=1 Tax=Erythrobacter sp. NAP1 TaxID=237727 RepID=UPI0000685160|nr:BCD family MFS transporter [Erythrobacter sp. NAP1]EAQ27791.1 possible Bch2, light harvesting pigment Major Facilitator Family(MFS) transporter [Erythrobacter sp. NAP1]